MSSVASVALESSTAAKRLQFFSTHQRFEQFGDEIVDSPLALPPKLADPTSEEMIGWVEEKEKVWASKRRNFSLFSDCRP